MKERMQAWRCIGCGRLEAPANCIGICEDRKIEIEDARDYDALERELAAERARCAQLLALVQCLAWSKPRPDTFERSYVALQVQARALLQQMQAVPLGTSRPAATRLEA
jgi:hypothetical protein